jgi:hypothetical protein
MLPSLSPSEAPVLLQLLLSSESKPFSTSRDAFLAAFTQDSFPASCAVVLLLDVSSQRRRVAASRHISTRPTAGGPLESELHSQ